GARLVRDAADVLDLLHATHPAAGATANEPEAHAAAATAAVRRGLSRRARLVLEQVGAGVDTTGKLTAGSTDAGAVLRTLGELERKGLVRRGDGGRYLLSQAQRWSCLR